MNKVTGNKTSLTIPNSIRKKKPTPDKNRPAKSPTSKEKEPTPDKSRPAESPINEEKKPTECGRKRTAIELARMRLSSSEQKYINRTLSINAQRLLSLMEEISRHSRTSTFDCVEFEKQDDLPRLTNASKNAILSCVRTLTQDDRNELKRLVKDANTWGTRAINQEDGYIGIKVKEVIKQVETSLKETV